MDHHRIRPIIVVGGASRRFGSDKLRRVLRTGDSEEWLIDRPLAALREVFGPRVAMVGECHPDVAARGDLVIEDRYPGVGPIGGILSALEHELDVFVLAGDLPRVTGEVVRTVLARAADVPGAVAVLARSSDGGGRLEPCVGLYRAQARDLLRARLDAGRRSLHDALEGATGPARVSWVEVRGELLANANTPEALD